MQEIWPGSEAELCAALADAAQSRRRIALGGAFTKRAMSGSADAEPAVRISTSRMRRVLNYEPRDLTISVEAGLPFAELTALLAENRQMVPLDPPYFATATVGGVIAANTAGPRRRLYGSARDLVIGMRFAQLDGKVTQSGGMVVKNVAGFDLAKLMIGSFGTLAAIAVVNFKLLPRPPQTRTFVLQFETAVACMHARNQILRGVLQPAAIDALNPDASRRAGLEGYNLLLEVGGSGAVIARYARELAGARPIEGDHAQRLWSAVREFSPDYVSLHNDAHVARVAATLVDTAAVFASSSGPIVSRAGSGVSYLYFPDAEHAQAWIAQPETAAWRYVFEYGTPADRNVFGSEFEMMKRVKRMFDPDGILNPGRLYGRI